MQNQGITNIDQQPMQTSLPTNTPVVQENEPNLEKKVENTDIIPKDKSEEEEQTKKKYSVLKKKYKALRTVSESISYS